MLRQDRKSARSDLVCGVAVRGNTVASHEYDIDLAGLHQNRRHVVTLNRRRDAGRVQFKACQPRALQQRPGLIAVDMHVTSLPAIFQRDIHRRGRRPVFRGGKSPRVAMRHDANGLAVLFEVLQKLKADPANVPADLDILLPDRIRFFI